MARKRDESVSIVVSGLWVCFMTCACTWTMLGDVSRRGGWATWHAVVAPRSIPRGGAGAAQGWEAVRQLVYGRPSGSTVRIGAAVSYQVF